MASYLIAKNTIGEQIPSHTFTSQILIEHANMAQENIHKIHPHQQRLICLRNQGWYLRTREGLKGPFTNQQSAQQFLENITKINCSKR